MRSIVCAAVPFALAALALVATLEPALSQPPPRWFCPDGLTTVDAATLTTARTICEQGEKARAHLAACGIEGRHAIDIRVGRDLGGSAKSRRAGDYDPHTGRARLLTYASYFQAARSRFGIAGTARVLHASVAAHEVAHGIFYEHTAKLDLPETAHEYVAYATQIATLPVDVQRAILAHSDFGPINNLFVFSFFLLRADPERFAVAAFRHFNQPENGCAFLRDVLDGKVHFPPPSD